MDIKKSLFIITVFIICMFTLMLASSYAWYSFKNGNTTFDVVTNNDDIKVTYHTGMYINTNTAIPIESNDIAQYSEKNKFSIDLQKESLVNKLLVDISLIDIEIDSELKNDNFNYELLYNENIVGQGNFKNVNNQELAIASNIVLETTNSNDFELRLYILDDNSNQNNMINKSFKGTIKVDVVSRLKSTIQQENVDILISDITIDGEKSTSLPTYGTYKMEAQCEKGSKLTWDPISKTITYNSGSKINDNCKLNFTSINNYEYPKLNSVKIGSYVKYKGNGGKVGTTNVACKTASTPSSEENAETESPNSCLGQNAREDLDQSNYTYGYCNSSHNKYTTTGWRIAYIDNSNPTSPQAVIISAASPECLTFTGNTNTYIQKSNTHALKYCNPNYTDGNCTCPDNDKDGLCDLASSDTWGINDNDFYQITTQSGTKGRHLTSELAGTNTEICYQIFSNKECGYNNDLLDNGADYLFATTSQKILGQSNALLWQNRHITSTTITDASFGFRPVIKLSSTVYITSGTGTKDNPYIIAN